MLVIFCLFVRELVLYTHKTLVNLKPAISWMTDFLQVQDNIITCGLNWEKSILRAYNIATKGAYDIIALHRILSRRLIPGSDREAFQDVI